MKKNEDVEARIDKAYTYLKSKFFPWNFLVEPTTHEALEHYMMFALPAAKVKMSELVQPVEAERILDSITEEIKNTSEDYLIDPYNQHARSVHGHFADDYPYAYAQALVFTMLHEGGKEVISYLDEIADIGSIAKLMGVTMESLKDRERIVGNLRSKYAAEERGPAEHSTLGGATVRGTDGLPSVKFRRIGDSARSLQHYGKILGAQMKGRRVMSRDGTELGILDNVVFEKNDGSISQVIVRLTEGVDAQGIAKSEDGLYGTVDISKIRLANPYNNHVVFKP